VNPAKRWSCGPRRGCTARPVCHFHALHPGHHPPRQLDILESEGIKLSRVVLGIRTCVRTWTSRGRHQARRFHPVRHIGKERYDYVIQENGGWRGGVPVRAPLPKDADRLSCLVELVKRAVPVTSCFPGHVRDGSILQPRHPRRLWLHIPVGRLCSRLREQASQKRTFIRCSLRPKRFLAFGL